MLGQGRHHDKIPFLITEDLPKVASESTDFLWEVNKAWYIQVSQDQVPHPVLRLNKASHLTEWASKSHLMYYG